MNYNTSIIAFNKCRVLLILIYCFSEVDIKNLIINTPTQP